jgi:hypothetical protein
VHELDPLARNITKANLGNLTLREASPQSNFGPSRVRVAVAMWTTKISGSVRPSFRASEHAAYGPLS